jgi:hypothetical protein
MACEFGLNAINIPCLNNSGGIITIALAPFESVTGYTSTVDSLGAINYITDINLAGTADTSFYIWQFAKNGANFTENSTGTIEAGSINYLTTLSLRIPRRQKAIRDSLAIAGAAYRNLLVLVKDGNSEWNLMGLTRGANLITSASGSGAVPDDGSFYDITITANEPNQMPFVLEAAALSVIVTA